MNAINVSLWDVENDTPKVKVRDTQVYPVSTGDVHEFCRRHHYAGHGGSAVWRWGLWAGATLLGVVAYNLPTRTTCESVFGPDHYDKVWHMGRLAMSDKAPHNSESRLIGASLKAIQKGHPHVWGVLTYADTSVGHLGYVYQATNAIYTGTGGDSSNLVDINGNRRGTNQQGARLPQAEIESRGWTRTKATPKHRYLYVLGNRTQKRQRMELLQMESLPYPKSTGLQATVGPPRQGGGKAVRDE